MNDFFFVFRGNSAFIMQDLDDATSLLELDMQQSQEAIRDWNLLGQSQQALNNSANNNINTNINNNQNSESGCVYLKSLH